MRSGTESALARVVNVFGSARPHHAYLFANRRANRMKVLVHGGVGIWLAARRLHSGKFAWPKDVTGTLTLTREQFDALVLGLPGKPGSGLALATSRRRAPGSGLAPATSQGLSISTLCLLRGRVHPSGSRGQVLPSQLPDEGPRAKPGSSEAGVRSCARNFIRQHVRPAVTCLARPDPSSSRPQLEAGVRYRLEGSGGSRGQVLPPQLHPATRRAGCDLLGKT